MMQWIMALAAARWAKIPGDDFIDQKITLPVILAWQDGDANDREFWQRTMGDGNFADGDLATAQAILASHDAIDRSIAIAGDYANAAIAALSRLSSPGQSQVPIIAALGACRQVFSSTAKLGTQTPAANKGHLLTPILTACARCEAVQHLLTAFFNIDQSRLAGNNSIIGASPHQSRQFAVPFF
jgi:hypothetical protein